MLNERAVVQVRLTARDHKRVEALAANKGVTVSEFVRRLIRRALDHDPARMPPSKQPARD